MARLRLPLMALALAGTATIPACASAPGAQGTGSIRIAVISRNGPVRQDLEDAAWSLTDLRDLMGCEATPGKCWPDAHVASGKDLLLAVTVQGCDPVTSVTGALRGADRLLVTMHHQNQTHIMACAGVGGIGTLWLVGAPCAELPPHAEITVEVVGADPPQPHRRPAGGRAAAVRRAPAADTRPDARRAL